MQTETPLVVITGTSGRLGRVAAREFQKAGYRVVGLERSIPDGSPIPVLTADVTSDASVTEAFDRISAEHGTPSVILHTVGMWSMAPLAETTLSEWQTMMDVNLTSSFLVFREGARRMSGKGGTLIAISSQQGSVRGTAQQAAYSASKAGVVRLVEAVAAEYADEGIRAHAVAPSMILFGGEEEGTKGVMAEELAAHFLYLASPAGASLNGSVLKAFG